MSFLSGVFQTLNNIFGAGVNTAIYFFDDIRTLLANLAGQVSVLAGSVAQGFNDLVDWVNSELQAVQDGFKTLFQAFQDYVNAELQLIKDGFQALSDTVTAALAKLGDIVTRLDQTLAERARQYLLARVAAAPLKVPFELLQVALGATGPKTLSDPNGVAPWAIIPRLRFDLQAVRGNGGSICAPCLDQLRADLSGWRSGPAPVLAPFPASPDALPGYDTITIGAGAAADDRGLLTPDDKTYIAKTTQ